MSWFKNQIASLSSIGDEFAKIKGAKANKDIVEAMVAGAVITGASDNSFTEGEKDETLEGIMVSKFVEVTGTTRDLVADILDKQAKMRPHTSGGKERLMEEIREAGRRPETAQYAKAIIYTWVDVASSENGIDAKERAAIIECGKALGVSDPGSLIPA